MMQDQDTSTGPVDSQQPSRTPGSVLSTLADTSINLKSWLLTLPEYGRRYADILRSPIEFFRAPPVTTEADFKKSIAFLLQGITLSFIILTMGRALPQSIATFTAVNLPLISGSRTDLIQYAQRVEAIGQTLSPELRRSWLQQGELMLAVRVLGEERFKVLLERLGEVSNEKADLLSLAIDGSLMQAERFGGRAYLLSFFTALNPHAGPLLYQSYQVAYAGPRYALQPHVEFLLSTLLFWYLACAILARFLPSPTGGARHAVFAVGALVCGFFYPLYQGFNTLLRFYLAVTLPIYIPMASQVLSGPPPPGLLDFSGGVFSYENLMLALVQVMVSLALLCAAASALTMGVRAVIPVSTRRAVAASVAGLVLGIGLTEAAMRLLVVILVPTGLL
jgi:hypothetical protein